MFGFILTIFIWRKRQRNVYKHIINLFNKYSSALFEPLSTTTYQSHYTNMYVESYTESHKIQAYRGGGNGREE